MQLKPQTFYRSRDGERFFVVGPLHVKHELRGLAFVGYLADAERQDFYTWGSAGNYTHPGTETPADLVEEL